MEKKAEDQKESLISIRTEKEEKMAKMSITREEEAFIRKEIEMIKREDKLENVERIFRANQHSQYKIMIKIKADQTRSQSLQEQKDYIMKLRADVRKKADKEKREMTHEVEKMKATGNFDRGALEKMGINLKGSPSP